MRMAEVSIVKCSAYESAQLAAAVRQAVELIGGIGRFVKPGQRVLLKPNLLKCAAPEEAATTHPEFVRQVIRLVKQQTDRIVVADSPAGLVKAEAVYERTGMTAVCRSEGVELARFDKITDTHGLPTAQLFDDVDVCINLPKLKTHNLTVITAAVKNVFGLVPGLYKVQCHKEHPNARVFSELIARIYQQLRPHLHLVDAVTAMEGDGPAAGKPRQVGLVVASADGVAADAVLGEIIGAGVGRVTTTSHAAKLGAGEADLRRITVKGAQLDEVRIPDFVLPQLMWLYQLPNSLTRLALRLVPLALTMDRRLCNGCLLCTRICPQQALLMVNGRPRVDARQCILCLCCAEMCPQKAVYLRFLKRRMYS